MFEKAVIATMILIIIVLVYFAFSRESTKSTREPVNQSLPPKKINLDKKDISLVWKGGKTPIGKYMQPIYVGDWNSSTNPDYLHYLGIKRVLCVNMTKKNKDMIAKYKKAGIDHKHISIDDEHDAKISDHFSDAYKYIAESPGPILLHCTAGVSRSVTIAAMALIKTGVCKTPQGALEYIRQTRPHAYPNLGFMKQLESII